MISKEKIKNEKYYIGLIILISSLLTIFYINFTLDIGIFCSDVYVYLVNAMYYSGQNIDANSDLWLTPLTCILTSLFFDLGLKNELSIFILTGILAILGNIGLYFLFRLKFNKILSFLGVIIYATFSLNLIWLGNGSLDIPSVSITIWVVLFALKAMNENYKYYPVAIITFLLGFLIRYPVVLILAPLLLYFVYKKKYKAPWPELKYLVYPLVGIVIAFVVMVFVIYLVSGEMDLIELGLNIIVGKKGTGLDPAYNTNIYYYAQNFFNFLSCSKITFYRNNPQLIQPTIISIIYGVILLVGGLITINDNRHIKISKKYGVITLILAILTVISFITLKSTITICIMLITLLFARKIFDDSKFDLNLLFLGWMLIYFIFYSGVDFKVNRYFIPILPVVSYFITYGICKIQQKIKINKYIIPVILTVVLLFAAFNTINTIEWDNEFNNPHEMSDYIIDEIPDYKNEKFASNAIRPYKWYLKIPILPVRHSDVHILDEDNITYYISKDKIDNLNNFEEIKNFGDIYLYKRAT